MAEPTSAPRDVFARVESIALRGRQLCSSPQAVVYFAAPFEVAARSDATEWRAMLRGVSWFAGIVTAIVGLLVAIGAAPLLLGIAPMTWLVGLVFLRRLAARSLGEHGKTTIDFERGELCFESERGDVTRAKLSSARLRALPNADEARPYWAVLTTGKTTIRLAACQELDWTRLATLFRTHHVEVDPSPWSEASP